MENNNKNLEELVKFEATGQIISTAGETHHCPPTFDGCGLPSGT